MYVIINTSKVRNTMNKKIVCASKLAELSGVKQSTIAHILTRGVYTRVQDKNLFAIAGALEVRPDTLTASFDDIERKKESLRKNIIACQKIANNPESIYRDKAPKRIEEARKELAYLEKLVK